MPPHQIQIPTTEYEADAEGADHDAALALPSTLLFKGRRVEGLADLVSTIQQLADRVADLNARLTELE